MDENVFEFDGSLVGPAKPWHAIRSVRDSGLDWSVKFVAMVMLSRASPHRTLGWHCFPSLPTIADDCGISVRQVQRSLAAMRDLGLVEWSTAYGGVSTYSFHLDAFMRLPLRDKLAKKKHDKSRRG